MAVGKTLEQRAAELTEAPDQQVRKQFSIDVSEKAISEEARTARFVITTQGVDRDNDTVSVTGWDVGNYLKSPVVLWAHDYSQMPVARAIELAASAAGLEAVAQFPAKGVYPFADCVFDMLKGGFLSATSVGFRPKSWMRNEDRGGIDFKEQELLEFSIVPVPANPEALVVARSKGIDVEPMREWAERTLECYHGKSGIWIPKDTTKTFTSAGGNHVVLAADVSAAAEKPAAVVEEAVATCTACSGQLTDGMCPACQAQGRAYTPAAVDTEEDTVRWNRALSKGFDVASEPLEASRTELAWVARYIECPVQQLSQEPMFVPGARMGSFLASLDERIGAWQVDALRNLTTSGKEVPPEVESIQLNSTTRRQFLVEGTRFLRRADGVKMVQKLERHWAGLHVTTFVRSDQTSVRNEFLDGVAQRAVQLNYLRGEAFRLSGEFLDRGSLDFADLFLEPQKEAVLRRIVDVVNEDGEHMPSRGVLLMGPPGTGKTLSGRVVMRQADSTFIWVSARDLHRSGAFGGLSYAFDIATECSPSVLFIEDVDNYLDSYVIDMLKTEMDGLKRRKGVVTILTTNFPELLPEALVDRPGRFHDIVEMSLPVESVRVRMLEAWCSDASETDRAQAAKDTEGFSGAHLFELASFARTLEKESKGAMSIGQALVKALEKIREQRELISSLRSQDYRPRLTVRSIVAATKAAVVSKRGRVLSNANEARLRTAQESLSTAAGQLSGVLSQLETAPEAPETAPEGEKEIVLRIASGVAETEPVTSFADVAEGIASVLRSELPAIGRIVQEETRAALARARGRVD